MKCEDCNYNTGLCNSCYVKNGVEENILDEIGENKRRDEYNEDEE